MVSFLCCLLDGFNKIEQFFMVDLPSQIVIRQNMKKNRLFLGFKGIAMTSKQSSCHEISGKNWQLASGS